MLKALEIVYRVNGDAVEGIVDRNGHIRKLVGGGGSFSWGGSQNKVKGCECKLSKKMFFRNDLLKLFLKEKHNITEFFPDTTVFYN